MLHHLAFPRGILSTDILTKLGLPPTNIGYYGENGIMNPATRLGVATRLYHLQKDQTSIEPNKHYEATVAARHALRLPSDLSGGAGRSAAPRRG